MSDTETTPSASAGEVTSDDIAAAWSSAEKATPAEADSSPASPAPSAPSAAPTTVVPAEAAPASPDTQGPIPFDRHRAALDNARAKARAEAESELRQKFSWAEKYSPEQVEQSSRLYQWLTTDPQGFAGYLQEQLKARAPQTPEMPQPDLKAEDGTPVYSAPRLQEFLTWQREQMMRDIQAQYEPVKQAMAYQQLEAQAGHTATTILKEARTNWPRFASLEPEIKRGMLANPAWSLQDAYIAAFQSGGIKAMEADIRAQYEGTLTEKANASAATTKPGPAPTTPKKYADMDLRDIVADVWAQLESSGSVR